MSIMSYDYSKLTKEQLIMRLTYSENALIELAEAADYYANDKNRENRPVGYEESAEFFKGRASAFRKAIQVIHGDD